MSDLPYDDDNMQDEAPIAAPRSSLRLGPGVHADVPIADYIADPCVEPSLRSSDLRRILRMTPAHVRAHHPRFSDKPEWAIRRATKRMEIGTVVHTLVLGHGAAFVVLDPKEFPTAKGEAAKGETKAYKQAVAAARAQGLIELKPKVCEAAERTAAALRAQIEADIESPITAHHVEHTLIWIEQTPHGPVYCRTRPDVMIIGDSDGFAVEIKSTDIDLDDHGVQSLLSSNDGGYLIQAAWQLRGMAACFPQLAGRVSHRFYFGEMGYPNLVAPVSPSTLAIEQANRRCLRAVEKFAEITDGGTNVEAWPSRIGYMAPWLERDWMEQETADAAAEA